MAYKTEQRMTCPHSSHDKLIKIWKEMESKPALEYYAAGDPKQLDAINDVITNDRKLRYLECEKLFPTTIELIENKRLRP